MDKISFPREKREVANSAERQQAELYKTPVLSRDVSDAHQPDEFEGLPPLMSPDGKVKSEVRKSGEAIPFSIGGCVDNTAAQGSTVGRDTLTSIAYSRISSMGQANTNSTPASFLGASNLRDEADSLFVNRQSNVSSNANATQKERKTPPPVACSFDRPSVASSKYSAAKADTYDSEKDFVNYKLHFEICARVNGWDSDQKFHILLTKLRGRALEFTAHCGREVNDYYQLCDLLLKRFSTLGLEDEFRLQAKTIVRKKDQTLKDLAQEIRQIMIKA